LQIRILKRKMGAKRSYKRRRIKRKKGNGVRKRV
jgi:hypothetical protein